LLGLIEKLGKSTDGLPIEFAIESVPPGISGDAVIEPPVLPSMTTIHTPHPEEKWKIMILPALRNILPKIFELVTSDNSAEWKMELPIIVQWMKRICDADVSLLHLLLPFSQGSADSSKAELLISSEDRLTPDTAAVLSSEMEISNLCIQKDSKLDDKKLSFKLFSQHSENGRNECGEVTILLPKHSNDNVLTGEEGCVELLSFLIMASINLASKFSSLKSINVKAYDIIHKYENSLAESQKELSSERLRLQGFRSRVSASSGLVIFSAKAAEISSLALLSGLISEVLPAILHVRSAALLIQCPTHIIAPTASNSQKLSETVVTTF
jgi:hypothetical protein